MGSPAEEEIKDKEIGTMLKNKILEAGFGEWANNIVMVKKADGTPRFCIDFRRLNDISRRDAFALSRIDEVLDTVGKHKVYSVMDAASAFWAVRLHPDDMDKTAFSSRKHLGPATVHRGAIWIEKCYSHILQSTDTCAARAAVEASNRMCR